MCFVLRLLWRWRGGYEFPKFQSFYHIYYLQTLPGYKQILKGIQSSEKNSNWLYRIHYNSHLATTLCLILSEVQYRSSICRFKLEPPVISNLTILMSYFSATKVSILSLLQSILLRNFLISFTLRTTNKSCSNNYTELDTQIYQ